MVEIAVKGMTCGGCVSAVTRAVKSVDPSADVRVDLATGSVRIEGAKDAAPFVRALTQAGYPASGAAVGQPHPQRRTGGCCG